MIVKYRTCKEGSAFYEWFFGGSVETMSRYLKISRRRAKKFFKQFDTNGVRLKKPPQQGQQPRHLKWKKKYLSLAQALLINRSPVYLKTSTPKQVNKEIMDKAEAKRLSKRAKVLNNLKSQPNYKQTVKEPASG